MNWPQLKAILWLRWRLTRNQFSKGGSINATISLLVLGMIGFGAVGFGIGGLAGGVAAGKLAKPDTLLLILDGAMALFCFIWLIGLLTELQRSESIDLGKLLHLPVTLKQVFLFNYAASHLTPALALAAPAIAGFCLGLTIGGGLRMAILGLVCLSVLLAITAWTYCLRGWFSSIMADRRRGRNVVMWITILFVGIAQLPQLVMHSRAKKSTVVFSEQFLTAHILVPPAWPGYSACTLKQGQVLPSLALIFAAALLTAGGLTRSYALTLRYYRDAQKKEPARKERATVGPPKRLMVERAFPLLRDDTAGLAWATLRNLMRVPEFKLALIMPAVILLVMAGGAISKFRSVPDARLVPFAVTAGVMLVPFTLGALMGNMFGLDRGGFRALVLSPMPRDQILLARNAAFLPVVLTGSVLVLSLMGLFFHAATTTFLTGLAQSVAGYALFALLSNYMSILVPYRYSMNSLQAKKLKPIAFLGALGSMIVWPLIVLFIAVPPALQFLWVFLGLPPWIPLNVISGLILAAIACWLYWLILPAQGKLLHRRELKILQEVTTESE